MKFMLCLLVLLPLVIFVEGSFLHEVDANHEKLCAIAQAINSLQASGTVTCEEACNTAVATILPGFSFICPAICKELQSGSPHCP